MNPIPLTFDVTDALPAEVTGGNRTTIAAWLFLPDDLSKLGSRPVTMTLLSGGSYDKRYFHVEIPGHQGYSCAEHLASLGNIVLVPDHLGVGDSSRAADQKKATRQVVALATHAAVVQFHERLSRGALHPGLPAIGNVVKAGAGHSLGGMQAITQQAEYRTYDVLMILGYTAAGAHLTMKGRQFSPDDGSLPSEATEDYSMGGRANLRETFHWGDVPAAVIGADDALLVPTPSKIGLDSIRKGIVRDDAARVEVPTYLCLGERDVSPDPHGEPAYYRRCADLTLHILPASGHCQNFASTRQQMWNRMHAWTRCVAGI